MAKVSKRDALTVAQAAELGPDQSWREGIPLRKQAFICEYLVDFNATAAVIRCGYSKNGASDRAYDLLRDPQVRAAISKLFDGRGVTAHRLIQEYANIAFANATDYVEIVDGRVTVRDTSEWTPEQKRAVVEISETITKYGTAVNVKFADKLRALDSLARARGMFVDRVDVSGTVKHEHETSREAIQETIEGLFERLASRQEANMKVIEHVPVQSLPAPNS